MSGLYHWRDLEDAANTVHVGAELTDDGFLESRAQAEGFCPECLLGMAVGTCNTEGEATAFYIGVVMGAMMANRKVK